MLQDPDRTPRVPPSTVVVVEGSAVQRRFLRTAVEADGDFTVVGEARDARQAIALVARLRPTAVLLDLDLPGAGGLEAIERIMSATPTPIVGCSASGARADSPDALQAVAAGAVDVLGKPGTADGGSLEGYGDALRRRLRVAARIRVITHPRGRLRSQGLTGPSHAVLGAAALQAQGATATLDEARPDVRLIAIGASTGGPQALLTLLGALPADLAQAVLVVQHMAEGFVPGLAAWLDELIPLPVVVGRSGQRLLPGTVTLAPSGGNLLVQDDRLRVLCVPPSAGQFHVPGIDATFASIAGALGPAAVGVLLTGMGRDGAAGLLAMHDRGALTLGQDEATSTVYGMPAAAAALHAVSRQLPLPQMADALLGAVGRAS